MHILGFEPVMDNENLSIEDKIDFINKCGDNNIVIDLFRPFAELHMNGKTHNQNNQVFWYANFANLCNEVVVMSGLRHKKPFDVRNLKFVLIAAHKFANTENMIEQSFEELVSYIYTKQSALASERHIIDIVSNKGPMYFIEIAKEAVSQHGVARGDVAEIILRLISRGTLKRNDEWKVVVNAK